MKKRILSVIIVSCMMLAAIPFVASAEVDAEAATAGELTAALTSGGGTLENPKVVMVTADIVLANEINMTAGCYVTLVSDGNHTIKRGNHSSWMIRLIGGALLNIGTDDGEYGVLTFDGARDGGGQSNIIIFVNGGTVNAYTGIFKNNVCQYDGSAFNITGTASFVNLYDVTLQNNSSAGGSGGGAFCVKDGGNVTINGGSYTGHSANGNGGAVSISGAASNLTVNGGSFGNNYTQYGSGSAIFSNGSTVVINGGTFNGTGENNNQHMVFSYNPGALLTINGGTFTNAKASAVYNHSSAGTLNVNGGTFENNGTVYNTPAILNERVMNFSGGSFINNTIAVISTHANAVLNMQGSVRLNSDNNIIRLGSGKKINIVGEFTTAGAVGAIENAGVGVQYLASENAGLLAAASAKFRALSGGNVYGFDANGFVSAGVTAPEYGADEPEDPSLSIASGVVTVSNAPAACILVIASYDGLKLVDAKTISNVAGPYTIADEISTAGAAKVKAFLWNNTDDITPLCEAAVQ